MQEMLETLYSNDTAGISNLIDTTGCSNVSSCRDCKGCDCSRCELYRATGLTPTEEVVALQMDVFVAVTSMETLYHLADQIVSHGAKATRVTPAPTDVTK